MIPYHLVDGNGEAVVLINSLGTTLEMWGRQFEPFSQRFRLVRMDTRGHGGTNAEAAAWTVDDMADDVAELLDGLGIERAHIVGISLGSAIAMTVAVRHSERVGRLVLTSAARKFGTEESWRERAATVRAEGCGAIADAAMARWFTDAFRREHPDTVELVHSGFADCDSEGYARCCEALATFDARGRLGGVEAETLVVYGTQDEVTTGEDAAALASEIGIAQVAAVEDAKHLVPVERPEDFDRLVIDFLTTDMRRP